MRRKNRDQIKDLERRVKRLEEDVSFSVRDYFD